MMFIHFPIHPNPPPQKKGSSSHRFDGSSSFKLSKLQSFRHIRVLIIRFFFVNRFLRRELNHASKKVDPSERRVPPSKRQRCHYPLDPSSELSHNYGKSPFSMGKLTINGHKWQFSIAMLNHQRVQCITTWKCPKMGLPWNHAFIYGHQYMEDSYGG